MAEPKLEKSACDGVVRPHGCGYRPPPGAISHLYTGNNGSGTEARHVMDLNAHGFGDTHTYDEAALLRRYGPGFHRTDETMPRFLALDFESLFGIGSNYLTKLACENKFGTAATTSCYPTLEELHDYFAANPGEAAAALGSSGGARVTPGQPDITAISSPQPGVVELSWKTRPNHTFFLAKVSTPFGFDVTNRKVDGSEATTHSTRLALPAGASGEFQVTVTAFIGNTAGKPSLPRTVNVIAATGEPIDNPPVDPPVDPPAPVDPPTPPTPTPVVKLSNDAQGTVRDMVGWRGKHIGTIKAERLQRLADELRERGLA